MRNIAVIILLIIPFCFLSGQIIEMTSMPEWAEPIEMEVSSTIDKYDVQNGFYYTRYDQVSNYELKSQFIRYKAKIINSSGVDYFSQINIPIDTSFQKYQLHSFNVYRNGTVDNREGSVDFQLLNNESNLEANVFSGLMNVNAILQDIRKDDVVEMAYSIIGKNPLYTDQYHEINSLQGLNHIDLLTYRFVYPEDKEFEVRFRDSSLIEVKREKVNDYIHLSTVGKNVTPVEIEETMSTSCNPYNICEISSHSSWLSVKSWAKELFQFENSSQLDSIYTSLYSPKRNIIQNATAILDFVQNQVRYTSVNGGMGSLKPTKPSEVINRNYGDCKDKSLLLVQLLRKLGIEESFPALVNSYAGKNLDTYLPGPELFDHAIVKCVVEGKSYWLDPTINLQGGSLDQRNLAEYGYALVLDDKMDLEYIQVSDVGSRTEIFEDFDFHSISGSSTLKVTSILKGNNANGMRLMLDYYSLKDLSQYFKEVYTAIYPDVQVEEKIEVKDDIEKNEITIVESYSIDSPWKEVEENGVRAYLLSFEPMNVYNYVMPISCDKKRYPIDLNSNLSYFQKTTMKLPEDAIYRLNNFKTENKNYQFEKNQKIIDLSNTEITYDIKYKTNEILPEDFGQYCKDVNANCRDLLLNIVWLPK